MSLKTKLLLLVTLGIAASVGAVAWLIELRTRQAFRQVNQQRTEALVAQFHREFERETDEITSAVTVIANSEPVLAMALKLSNGVDSAGYISQASDFATIQHLDFLELLAPDGTIISSAQWPARFGYRQRWFLEPPAPIPQQAFLRQVETPQGNVLGILFIRTVPAHGENYYVVGGRKLDSAVQSLATPVGMRTLIYNSPEQGSSGFLGSSGDNRDPDVLVPLVQTALRDPRQEPSATIPWSNGAQEIFYAIALPGFNDKPAAVLLVGNSLVKQQELEAHIDRVSLLIALSGIVLGLMVSGVIAAHVTRPVKELADAAAEIGGGNWQVHVGSSSNSKDEIGQLAQAFNQMTDELIAQRERLVQSERVAAWRELARRLAHELKNPLFPLQLTVENLLRAQQASPEEFEEVFRESTSTLLAEIANLKTIIGRFSDFSRMPAPQLQSIDLNDTVRDVAQLFHGQLQRENGRIETVMELGGVPPLSADPVLLRRVIENLVLNAIDAMPQGGRLIFRTATVDRYAIFEVSDTGVGLTPEECERVFTPYYTSKQHGTGLGLAIVQSVISDHNGRISVSSRKEEGTTFHIELPMENQNLVLSS